MNELKELLLPLINLLFIAYLAYITFKQKRTIKNLYDAVVLAILYRKFIKQLKRNEKATSELIDVELDEAFKNTNCEDLHFKKIELSPDFGKNMQLSKDIITESVAKINATEKRLDEALQPFINMMKAAELKQQSKK